jgi:hypothetical protein
MSHNFDRYVIGPNSYMLQICDSYLSHNCNRYLSHDCDIYLLHNCDIYLSHNCNRYLSHNCDIYVMGPNSYMSQICDRYFHTYILQIFYRTLTYICHISVSLVRAYTNYLRNMHSYCTKEVNHISKTTE